MERTQQQNTSDTAVPFLSSGGCSRGFSVIALTVTCFFFAAFCSVGTPQQLHLHSLLQARSVAGQAAPQRRSAQTVTFASNIQCPHKHMAPLAADDAGRIHMEVMAHSEDADILIRPCVDCGKVTGCFCDYCFARNRVPRERWVKGQMTPLCISCDANHGCCHYCRHVQMATPFSWMDETPDASKKTTQ